MDIIIILSAIIAAQMVVIFFLQKQAKKDVKAIQYWKDYSEDLRNHYWKTVDTFFKKEDVRSQVIKEMNKDIQTWERQEE